MLVLPLLTSLTQGWAIGWASCPYDPVWAERYPKRAALGLVAGVFVSPESVSFDSIVEFASGGPAFITSLLSVFVVMDVFLAAFNLLPLPPLDGAAVLTIALPEHYVLKLRDLYATQMISMVGLLVAWKVFPVVTDPLFSMVLKIVYPGESYS